MKRVILLFAILFYTAGSVFAGSKEMFSIDKDMISTELSYLSNLENHVKASSATFSNLKSENNALVANVSGNNFTSFTSMGDPPLGISSFIWGFCFGVPGLAVVYIVTEDSEETKKALWGCVAGTAVSAVIYLVYVNAVLNSAVYY
jgi:hypothetical protein